MGDEKSVDLTFCIGFTYVITRLKKSHVHGADSRINVCGLTVSLHINVSKDEIVKTVEKKCDHCLHTSNQWYAFETYLTNIFRMGADILNRFKSRYKL